MMESASLQSAKSYRRADMNCAMESVFAEYQRDMLEEFDLFVLDASYESSDYSEERIFDRLSIMDIRHGTDNETGAIVDGL